jgi:hypothetical protein
LAEIKASPRLTSSDDATTNSHSGKRPEGQQNKKLACAYLNSALVG